MDALLWCRKGAVELSFAGFVARAVPYALVQIVLAVAYVLVFLR